MKIAVIVVCYEDGGEHSMLSRTIRETWGKTMRYGAEIHYLWANGRKKQFDNDFIVDIPDSHGAMLRTMMAFWKHKKDGDYDYCVKTNTGAYLDIPRLVEFLQDKPRSRFYTGTPSRWMNIPFVSGSCITMSWDLCRMMANSESDVNYNHIDDVSIGEFMMQAGVPIHEGAIRVTFHGTGKILQVGAEVIPEPQFPYEKVYHYRLRCDDGKRHVDCEHMKRLYKELNA